MNLIYFLTIATVLSVTLGEFGQYPFGTSNLSISLTDILLTMTLSLLAIWKIGIKRDLKLPTPFKALIIFYLVGFLSLIVSTNFTGVFYLLRFVIYSLGFYLGFCLISEDKKRLNTILKLIVLTSLILSFAGFIQLLILPDLERLTVYGYDPHVNRLVATFLDPNLLGAFLNLGFAGSLYFWLVKKQKKYFISLAIILLAIILTFSRSAYLMLMVVTFIFGWLRNKKIVLASLLIALLLFLLVPKVNSRVMGLINLDNSALARVESWQRGAILFSKHPVLGVGFNNLRTAFEQNNLQNLQFATGGNSGAGLDSSLLLVASTTGIVGLFVFLLFWYLTLKKINLKSPEAIVLLSILGGLFINSQFINSFFYPPIMLLIFLLVGSFLGLKENAKN